MSNDHVVLIATAPAQMDEPGCEVVLIENEDAIG